MHPATYIRHAEKSDFQAIARLMVGMGFDHSAEEIERRWTLVTGFGVIASRFKLR